MSDKVEEKFNLTTTTTLDGSGGGGGDSWDVSVPQVTLFTRVFVSRQLMEMLVFWVKEIINYE